MSEANGDWKPYQPVAKQIGVESFNEWVKVPGTNFEVMIRPNERLGLFYVRATMKNPTKRGPGRPPKEAS